MSDEHDFGAYAYTAQLDASGWAWEFLRRNPEYRRQWLEFMETWHALESDYGVAPARDYPRWKRDRRANVFEPPLLEGESADQWVTRTGNDCVAIECAFGARWGLFKFPPDPSKNAVELGDALGWREVPQLAKVMTASDSEYLGQSPHQLALGFDLDMPLKRQLEEARTFLIARQHRLKRDGELALRRISTARASWISMLCFLDANEACSALAEEDKDRATALMKGGYRALLAWPP